MTDKEIEARLASKKRGEEVFDEFFKVTPNILKMNDIEIYNKAVTLTGCKPVYTEIAIYLLDYISVLRDIYSNPPLLEALKKFEDEKEEPQEVYRFSVRKENN